MLCIHPTDLCVGLALLCSLPATAQFDGAFIIDATPASMGITRIATGDLNADGFPDVVTSNGYDQGRITVYWNQQGSLFQAPSTVIDPHAVMAEDVAVADLDLDGRPDVVSVLRSPGEVRWYPNEGGSFGAAVAIDTGRVWLNGIVAGDVDADGDPDLVLIGQHSIDLYRNDGTGHFTREAILTTVTSPLPLECMAITLVDIDADGDLDPITAETIGPVIYRNDGTGHFTPIVVAPQPLIQQRVATGDPDGDGDLDIVVVSFLGTALWYRNDAGVWADGGALLNGAMIRELHLFEVDGDGRTDMVVSRGTTIGVVQGAANAAFAPEQVVFTSLSFIDGLAATDVDQDGREDLIWSAPAGTIAYQLNVSSVGVEGSGLRPQFQLWQDADALTVHFEGPGLERTWCTDVQGRVVRRFEPVPSGGRLFIGDLPTGTYLLRSARHGTHRWVKP